MKNKKNAENPDVANDVIPNSTEENNSSEEAKIEFIELEKYNDLNDRFLRTHAEFDNYRKRSNKEKVDLISFANASLLKDLLPILDYFDRALANNLTATDIAIVKEGFSLIFNKFSSILDAKGVKPMDCKLQVFDSEFHEAIGNLPVDDKDLKGKIVEDVEKGYLLNDKVIRFAKVVVGQ
jgi:molecular chaperone GrpE